MISTLPPLQHPEIYLLFENDLEIPDAVLDPILALPRDSLIADLETLVRFATNLDTENLTEDDTWFFFHALMLLAELRSEQSLPLILDVLGMPEDDLRFWFGDMPLEDFWAIVLWCGENRIPDLEEFIKDQTVPDEYMRGVALDALEQIAFHFPGRQEEIVKTLGKLLIWFNELETFEEEDFYPATSLTDTMANLGALEYLPVIEDLFEKERVDVFVRGDWEEYLATFNENYNSDRHLWNTYRQWLDTRGKSWLQIIAKNEQYAMEAEKRRLEKELGQKKEEEKRLKRDLQQMLLKKHLLSGRGDKIGRNDPCPCGSGKKYKRCCGA